MALGTIRDLLERSDEVAALEQHFAAVTAESRGRLVLVRGEAGVGKTSLLRHVSDQHRQSARILSGACDQLFTPRPLGPFIDIAQVTGGELERTIKAGGKPYEVAEALMRELRVGPLTIVVLEDLHWADEATIDVLRLLGRRVESIPALVLASYRGEELDRTHPLRILLGDLPAGVMVAHLPLAPLSRAAVAQLAGPHGVDATELYRQTGGNPFFVTEVLASGEELIPHTVRDAVLARESRLTAAGRTLLEAVAVAAPQAELWLLNAVAPDAVDRVEECLASGILVSNEVGLTFRHELARLATEESLPLDRRVALHRGVLAALTAQPVVDPDPGRAAYHAEAAGDAEAVRRWAPAAAQRATALGAHREAAAHYASALRFAEGAARERLADLLERRAYACYLTGQFAEALEAEQRALECHRTLRDRLREGDSLRSLSRLLRYVGRTAEAAVVGQEAVAVLEPLKPGHELAMAYCHVCHIFIWAEDAEGAVSWAQRALDLAEQLGDVEARVYSHINLGYIDYLAGRPEGNPTLERALKQAQDAGLDEHAGRAFVGLTWYAPRRKWYRLADRYIDSGLDYCTERGLDLWRLYLLAYMARRDLAWGAGMPQSNQPGW